MNKKIQKIFLALLLFAFLNMTFAPPAHAEEWGASMMAAIWKETTERMYKSIQDTILANLKMAALRIIQTRLMSLLGSGGSSGTPGVADFIINDWKMFIYSSATRYSDQMTTDFFRNVNAGATSAVRQYVTGPAERAVMSDSYAMRPDLQKYVRGGDPSKIFTPGYSSNPKMGWQMAAMPQNDSAFTLLRALSEKQAAYNREVAAKQAEGIAGQGYKGKEVTASNGKKVTVPRGSDYKGQNITTPGSMIGSLAEDVTVRMKTQMLSMARSVPEVVTAMVNQMLTQVIQQGLSKMTSPGGSGSMSTSQMTSQMTQQAQYLIQNGIRQAASPNTFFGR